MLYECNKGYRLSSVSNRLKCNLDGNWVRSTLPNCARVTCPAPPVLANGSRQYERPPVSGSRATYSCAAGFVMTGEPEMHCSNGGLWNGSTPTCSPISCPPLGGIPHGTLTGDQFTYLSFVEYSCNAGYVLSGGGETVRRTCTADGQWLPEIPTCERRKCPSVEAIQHGRTIAHGDPVYGSQVEFVCDAGFRLEGQTKLTCLESGRWSDEVPSCTKVFCPKPAPIENGGAFTTRRFNVSVYRPGSVVRYGCDAGFEMEGKTTRSCRSDGTWSGPTPRCVAVRCRPPNSIEHGRFTPKIHARYGGTVEYQCDPGFQLDGPAVRICSNSSQWSGSDPKCERAECEDPDPIPHGRIVGSERSIGAEVIYQCDDEYRLVGDAVRNCTKEAEWSGNRPVCRVLVECDKPSAVVSNGRMIGSNFSETATIHYVCDEGYFIDGVANRTCQADGTWDYPIPVCERVECPRPPRPANSRVEGIAYRFRERLLYSCRTGYRLIGPSERICQTNRTWSDAEPRCEPVECPQPSNLTNGEVFVDGRSYQDGVNYQCDIGYQLEGPERRICGEDGQWTDVEPECVKITCNQPPSIEFGSPLNEEWNPGEEVAYTCDEGYQLSEFQTLLCSDTGNFTGVEPQCMKIECPELQAISHAEPNATGNGLGSVATYVCHRGFELVGSAELVCTENSTWSGDPPTCVRITCPPPDFVPNAVIRSSGYEFQSNLQYECITGFGLKSGNLSRECTADGVWSGATPVCVATAVCPKPRLVNGFIASTTGDQSIEHHVVNMEQFVAGLTVEFDCEEGFNLVGEGTVTCLENSTWSSELPTCVRVRCPEPQINNSVLLAPKGFLYGFRVLIACQEGFELVGSSELVCLFDGSWSMQLPECRQLVCEEPTTSTDLEIYIVSTPNAQFAYPVGAEIGFRCKEGYTLEGDEKARCEHDQSWSTVVPTCAEITCSPPLIETNSSTAVPQIDSDKDDYSYGETISFSCPGVEFQIVGSTELACVDDRQWNASVPICQLRLCPPVNVRHGNIVTSSNSSLPYNAVGSQITVQCDDGFHPDDVSTANCTLDGVWSNELVTTCKKTLCPEPTVINGKPIVVGDELSTEYLVGVQILIECDGGFLLPDGAPSSLHCTAAGLWSHMLPICIRVRCPPVIIEGALIFYNGTTVKNSSTVYSYGDEIRVECMTGYNLVGLGSLTCQSSGGWSHRLPVCELVLCPDPGVPHSTVHAFGLPSGSSFNYTFGMVVYFVCDTGFQISGSAENLCLDDGTWDVSFPRCDPVLCPELVINHAKVDYRDREFESRVRVSCDDGYELFGDAILVCQASGMWSGVRPVCRQISCALPRIADARIVGTSTRTHRGGGNGTMNYGAEIVVQCHEGFELVGEPRLACSMNRTWFPAAPTCQRVECDDPLSMPISHLELDVRRPEELSDAETHRFVYGTEIRFTCLIGYRRVGVPAITCNATAQWSDDSRPSCDTVYCPMPRISHGSVQTSSVNNSFAFGDSVSFRCDAGFILQGEMELFCQPNGEWSDEFPICERRSCPPAPRIDHGSVVAPPTPKFEDVAVYHCETGHDLVGGNNASCNEHGQWTTLPSCLLVRCAPPESVPHGTYMPTGSTYGSILRYACNRGYELDGDADHMCQANRTWSGDVPTCRRVRCVQAPPRIPHADLLGETPAEFGARLTLSCHDGYRLNGLPTVECLWNGSWSHSVSSCDVISCGPPPYVRHADAAGSRRREYNTVVRYICKVGYQLLGSVNTSTCLANGSWSHVDVQCIVVSCPTPNIPAGGQIVVNRGYPVGDLDLLERLNPEGFEYGDRVWVSCDSERELQGAGFRICGSDGRWNGTEPECRRIKCRPPPVRPNVIYDYDVQEVTHPREFYVGHVIDVSCEVGFHVVRDHQRIICQADRSWNISTHLSLCRRTVCSSPGNIRGGHYVVMDGGQFADSKFDFGTVVSYSCQPGYVLVGERRAACGENGRWSNVDAVPSCAVVNCSRLEPPANGYLENDDGLSFGSNADFFCNRGYKLIGSQRLNCRHEGNWNGSVPACKVVSCGPPPRLANSSVSSNSTTYGSIAYYRCQSGFEDSSGSDNLSKTCDSYGLWSGPESSCQKIKCPEPAQPEHGYYTGFEFLFDSFVTYLCHSGYKLVGESRRRCRADKTWSGSVPVCERLKCPTPRAPVNGRIVNYVVDSFSGATLEFECDLGFRLDGSRLVNCTEEEMWSSEFPRCDVVSCGLPPSVDHAVVEGAAFYFNDVAHYVCRRGFQRSGVGSVRCLADGTWDLGGGPPVCNRVRCETPPAVDHASMVESGLRYGDVVYYVCADGYDLNGNNLLECGADGRWIGDLPSCERVTCGVVPVIPHATTIVRRTTLGSRATYHCNRGYTLTGSSYVECKPNRTWSYMDRPACHPVDCGVPPLPSSAGTEVRYNSTVFKDTAIYYCLEGFQIDSSSTVAVCGENEKWNVTVDSAPACKPVPCPEISAPDNGQVRVIRDNVDIGSRATFGDEAEFSCDTGYQLIGDVAIACQSDGRWSGSRTPHCRRKWATVTYIVFLLIDCRA